MKHLKSDQEKTPIQEKEAQLALVVLESEALQRRQNVLSNDLLRLQRIQAYKDQVANLKSAVAGNVRSTVGYLEAADRKAYESAMDTVLRAVAELIYGECPE